MKVTIRSVHGHGDYDKEYVVLDVKDDCDIGRYLVADSTYTSETKVSNKLRHLYWFPDKQVKKGEIVVLYTKSGKNYSGTTDRGTPVHYFYWELGVPVWNDTGDCAVLIEANTWEFKRAK